MYNSGSWEQKYAQMQSQSLGIPSMENMFSKMWPNPLQNPMPTSMQNPMATQMSWVKPMEKKDPNTSGINPPKLSKLPEDNPAFKIHQAIVMPPQLDMKNSQNDEQSIVMPPQLDMNNSQYNGQSGPEWWYCDVCDRNMRCVHKANHLKGLQHRKKDLEWTNSRKNHKGKWVCTVCQRTMKMSDKEAHLAGKQHKLALVDPKYKRVMWICDVCDRMVSTEKKFSHLNSLRHRKKEMEILTGTKKLGQKILNVRRKHNQVLTGKKSTVSKTERPTMKEEPLATCVNCKKIKSSVSFSLEQMSKIEYRHCRTCLDLINLFQQGGYNQPQYRYLSLAVECVKVGADQKERAPCHVCLVNTNGNILVDELIRVPRKVMTRGISLSQVVHNLKVLLGKNVVLIGHHTQNAIKVLHLEKGIDYIDGIDLAEEFKYFCDRYRDYIQFRLAQEIYGLLKITLHTDAASPVTDAQLCMRLYLEWVRTGKSGVAASILGLMWENNYFVL